LQDGVSTTIHVGNMSMEKEIASAMCLHPIDTKEASEALCKARRKVVSIQRMDGAVENLATHERNENLSCTTTFNVNADTANIR
jgi:hypothetical protein